MQLIQIILTKKDNHNNIANDDWDNNDYDDNNNSD